MLKRLGLVVLAVIGALVGYAAIQSPNYTVYREIEIKAPAETIFAMINNARAAERWMPWSELDPGVKMTYSGPEEGVGAKASWESKGQMGIGSSTISGSTPNQSVQFNLETVKPFAMKQDAEISIRPSGDHHVVRWSVSGKSPFFGRLMCVFFSMDKMVGGSFEKGLAKLKILTEA